MRRTFHIRFFYVTFLFVLEVRGTVHSPNSVRRILPFFLFQLVRDCFTSDEKYSLSRREESNKNELFACVSALQ